MSIQPDYRLERDGVALADWLWRLVDKEATTRRAAGDALQAMSWGVPSVHTELEHLDPFPDVSGQQVRFEAAVRKILSIAGFDCVSYVAKLVALKLALNADWSERAEIETEKREARDDNYERIAKPLNEATKAVDETTRQRAERCLTRLNKVYFAGAYNCEDNAYTDAESMTSVSVALHLVFNLLGEAAMAAPDAISALLDCPGLRHEGLQAIERGAPKAGIFGQRLLREMRESAATQETRWFDGWLALGAVASHDVSVVHSLASSLASTDRKLQEAAASALSNTSKLPDEVCDAVIDNLLRLMEDSDQAYFPVMAAAGLGSDDRRVREAIVEMASPKPPQIQPVEGYPDLTHDVSMHRRGAAIHAMRRLTDYPAICIPVLIEALDSFEEFDPDEDDEGPFGRVAITLAAFGESAAAAVPRLVDKMAEYPEEYPKVIIKALAAIGPAAVKSVPALMAIREDEIDDDWLADLHAEVIDPVEDLTGWAIQQILGVPECGS